MLVNINNSQNISFYQRHEVVWRCCRRGGELAGSDQQATMAGASAELEK